MEGVDEMAVLPQPECRRMMRARAFPVIHPKKPSQLDDNNNKATDPKALPAHTRAVPLEDGRQIFKVPAQLTTMNKDSYAPRMVSFGPYHHGSPQLAVAEKFKLKVVDMFVSKLDKSREELFADVLKMIDEIKRCYVDGITEDDEFMFKDIELAKIMLRDTFFLIYLMQKAMRASKLNIDTDKFLIENSFGSAAIPFLYTDMLLLDNQIPLSIVNLFISLIHDDKEAEAKEDASSFALRYLREGLLMDDKKITSFPAKDGKQPLHLLDAYWRLITAEEYSNGAQEQVQVQVDPPDAIAVYRHINRPFRSVTDLKAKGVHFKPIDSLCVRHIKFDSWVLQLPILSIDVSAKVVYSNLIAYEMSPGSTSEYVVTSYINFIKSLLITSKDVNELREKEILFSTHDTDEHVIKQFKEINTYGLDNPDIFSEVKNKIEKHCKLKMGPWMVELIYTYFRSPWTVISLVAAAFLLVLTAIQTFT